MSVHVSPHMLATPHSGASGANARAETELNGKWVGQFNGVQIEIPPERGPFGYPREEAKGTQTPRFVQQTLQFDIETQSKGLAVGIWTAGECAILRRPK
jgi:hypothetical protein